MAFIEETKEYKKEKPTERAQLQKGTLVEK